jgi:hypothetical protein
MSLSLRHFAQIPLVFQFLSRLSVLAADTLWIRVGIIGRCALPASWVAGGLDTIASVPIPVALEPHQ